MIDVNALRRMQNNMTGGRVVKDLVNQILIDKNQDLRCGRLMVDKRYRKIFNIKPFDIKNKLNKKSLKELFSQPKIPTTGQNYVAPMNNNMNTKHILNLENSDPVSSNENSGGKLKNKGNRNDLYELLYGLK